MSMKELIFGAGNKAKVQQLKDALEGLNIEVSSIKDLDIDLPEVEEDGATVVENARKKSVAYAKAIDQIVFSMDNALYFEGVDDSEQPGLFVRRINGFEASNDAEMLQHYSDFLSEKGGKLDAHWEYALSIAQPDGTSVEDTIISPRKFVSNPSSTVVEGYPLEAIQIDPETGMYISEMTDRQRAEYWQRAVGQPLKDFISANL